MLTHCRQGIVTQQSLKAGYSDGNEVILAALTSQQKRRKEFVALWHCTIVSFALLQQSTKLDYPSLRCLTVLSD